MRLPLLGEHNFVAFGVDRHGEMEGVLGSVIGFSRESAPCFLEERDGGAEVVALEAHAGPSAFAFAATVDADDGSAKGELCHGVVLVHQFGAKEVAIEPQCAIHVSGPNDVFNFFDVHGRSLYLTIFCLAFSQAMMPPSRW
jgi:hypothetical protein